MTFLTIDKIALSISFKHHSQGGGTWSSLCDGSAILDCVVWFEEIRWVRRFWRKVLLKSKSIYIEWSILCAYETHPFGNTIKKQCMKIGTRVFSKYTKIQHDCIMVQSDSVRVVVQSNMILSLQLQHVSVWTNQRAKWTLCLWFCIKIWFSGNDVKFWGWSHVLMRKPDLPKIFCHRFLGVGSR